MPARPAAGPDLPVVACASLRFKKGPPLHNLAHVGCRTCVHHYVPLGKGGGKRLAFTEKEEVFGPKVVHGDAPNPTKL